MQWLASGEPIFWIQGKPASGKSTLMNYLSSNQQLLAAHLLSSTSYDWVVVYHFFDFRSKKHLPNSFSGFLRSLLLQLCSELPEYRESARMADLARKLKTQEYSANDLESAVNEVFKSTVRPVLLLVDGLDEYEAARFGATETTKPELCKFLKGICSRRTRVCIASRPDPPFPTEFRGVRTIKMDLLNKPGILSFATEELTDISISGDSQHPTRVLEPRLKSLAEDIAERASGVFLWARFAVTQIQEGESYAENADELQQRLDQVPDDLKDIYSKILSRMTVQNKEVTCRLLLLLADAKETINLQQLYAAMSLVARQPKQDPAPRPKTYNASSNITRLDDFRKMILARAGGLIETFEVQDWYYRRWEPVRITHRTVVAYLEETEWKEFGDPEDRLFQPNYLWLEVCRELLRAVDPSSNAGAQDSDVQSTPAEWESAPSTISGPHNRIDFEGQGPAAFYDALSQYVLVYFPEHARGFEDAATSSPYKLLGDAVSDQWAIAHINRCELGGPCGDLKPTHPSNHLLRHWYGKVNPSLVLALAHGLVLFFLDSVRAKTGRQPQISEGCSSPSMHQMQERSKLLAKQTIDYAATNAMAIYTAIKSGNVSMINSCLLMNPIIDDRAFRLALRRGSLRLVEMLLRHVKTANGDLVFMSKDEDETSSHLRADEFEQEFPMRPLWDVAKRNTNGDQDAVDLIDLFLQRGEDINAQCGPQGTALHSVVKSAANGSYYCPLVLRALVQRGADINAIGSHGTPLEYFWMLVNTFGLSHWSFKLAIYDLISLGGVNNKKDPNGLVPDVARMESWGTDIEQDRRYYRFGTVLRLEG